MPNELLELMEKVEKEQVSEQPTALAIPAAPVTPTWVVFTWLCLELETHL